VAHVAGRAGGDQAEQKVVAPHAVDPEVRHRHALLAEAGARQHGARRLVGGDARRLDPVQAQPLKAEPGHGGDPGHGVTAPDVGLADPVADGAHLGHAAPDVGKGDAAHHHAVGGAK
jgi:hypothetical protein